MENPKTISELYDLAKSRRHGEDGHAFVDYGRVGNRVADRVKHELGIDIRGFVLRIDEQRIRHAEAGHGEESEHRGNQVPLCKSDYEMLEEVVNNPDNIQPGRDTKQGMKTLQFTKRVNGHVLVIQAAHRRKKFLSVVTMWKYECETKGEAE